MISLPFGNRRAAFIYFKLPAGDFKDYARTIEELIRPHLRSGESLELTYGMGGCDLQVRLDLHNFRPVALIQDALLDADGLSCSWVFTSPYEIGVPDESSSLRFTSHLRINRDIYFANGVRAEREVLSKLAELLDEARNRWSIYGEIHGGIGWSDLVITGAFSGSALGLLTLLLKIRELHIRHPEDSAKRQFIVQKSLTVLGIAAPHGIVDWANCHISMGFQTSTRIRTTPGGFRQALQQLIGAEVGEHSVFAHEGTCDLSVFPRPAGELPSLFDATAAINQITHGTAGAPVSGIEHTETQLLFADPTQAIEELESADEVGQLALALDFAESLSSPFRESEIVRSSRPSRKNIPTCLQASAIRANLARIERFRTTSGKLARLLPKSLTETLSNVLSILNYSAFDEINHFDSRPAISACLYGLQNVLRNLDQTFQDLRRAPSDQADFTFRQLENFQTILRDWCDLAQRIVSERAAGTFEEFFGVSDRLASFRGGIQKYLTISDQILHEFYLRAQGGRFPRMCHRFASVHEPIDEIKSVPYLGVVKIPIRNRFSLSRAIPDLWHEVGIYIFYAKYRRGRKAFLRSLFKTFHDRREAQDSEVQEIAVTTTLRHILQAHREAFCEADDLENFLKSNIDPKEYHRQVQSSVNSQSGARLISNHDVVVNWTDDQVFNELSEMYADILVFFHGFRRSMFDFVSNLACSRLELLSTANYPLSRLIKEYSRLLRRVFVVRDFQRRFSDPDCSRIRIGNSISAEVEAIAETIREQFMTTVRFSDQWLHDPDFFPIEAQEASIRDAVDLLWSYRYEDIYYPVVGEAVRDLRRKVEKLGEPEPIGTPAGVQNLREGVSIDIDISELNDYYLHIHLEDFSGFLGSKRRDYEGGQLAFDDSPTDMLQLRSALARSALIAIHRSQILRHRHDQS